MKKLLLFTMLLSFGLISFGQTYLLEDFSNGNMPPTGWTIDGFATQWSINDGNTAGGEAPEAMFTYTNGNSTTRLVSPEIDLTGVQSIKLQFNHFLDDYSHTGYSIGVATRSGGGDWTDAWTVNPTGDMGPETISVNIDNDDVGATDFQFCIYVSGNFYNLDYWYLDDIQLFVPLNLDAKMTLISTPTYSFNASPVTGRTTNMGETTITDMEISWKIDDGVTTTTTFSGLSLAFGESYDFTCDGLIDLPIGSYTLTTNIETVNGVADDDETNNMLEKTVIFISNSVAHRPCLEEFTSSTCAPCASFNASFVPWCNNNEESITLVKYQMNWPGSGDPYYTEEGGVRRNMYGVSWVPWANVDGTYSDNNMATIQTMYEASMEKPGLVSLVGTHHLEGTVMDIDVNMVPFWSIGEATVYIVVFEYITTENATTNGETEFEHVMMKMVPDAYGTDVNFEDRTPVTISESVDLAGTNVEEWNDLGVAVIVQDMNSMYIFQSDYSAEDAVYNDDAQLSEIMVDGQALEDFSPDVYDYTITLEEGTVEIPEVTVTASDENAMPIVVPANTLPGTTTISVFAEDIATYQTYTITFDIDTDIEETALNAVKVFPNPTTGKVIISGVEDAQVVVYNTAGAVMGVYDNFDAGTLDLSNLEEGVYFLNILIDNQTVLNKKVSILR